MLLIGKIDDQADFTSKFLTSLSVYQPRDDLTFNSKLHITRIKTEQDEDAKNHISTYKLDCVIETVIDFKYSFQGSKICSSSLFEIVLFLP